MKLNLPEYTKTKYWCKSYPKGFPSDVTIPRVGLPQLIEDAVRENHGRVAMLYGGEEITYDTLGNQIGYFASALYALGVTKGQTVALFLPNCPQFAIAYYGALKIGAMVTALSPLFMIPEVEEVLYQHPAVSQAAVIGVPDPVGRASMFKGRSFWFFVSESAAAFSYKELGFSLSDSLFLFVFSPPGALVTFPVYPG